jgi:hypothetical protein
MYATVTVLQIPGRASGHDPYLDRSSTHVTVVPASKQRTYTEGVDAEGREDTVGAVPMWSWAPRQRAFTTLCTQSSDRGARTGNEISRRMHVKQRTGPRAIRVRVRAL